MRNFLFIGQDFIAKNVLRLIIVARLMICTREAISFFKITSNYSRFATYAKRVASEFKSRTFQVTPILGQELPFTRGVNSIPAVQVVEIPRVELYAFKRFNGIFHRSRCIIPVRISPKPFDFHENSSGPGPTVIFQSKSLIAIRRPSEYLRLEKAIYIGARASYNYHHWMVNALPSLYLATNVAKSHYDYPVIIPEDVRSRPTLWEPTAALLEGRDVVLWNRSQGIQLDKCVTILPPPVYDTPMSASLSARVSLSIHLPVMRAYRSFLLNKFAKSRRNDPRIRLFIARPRSSERSPHQGKMIEIAREFGFSIVRPEELSFQEQVEIFSRASHVIGPAGAGFTNVLFCPEGAKVMHWQQEFLIEQNNFANLAAVAGAECFSFCVGKQKEISGTALTNGNSLELLREGLDQLLKN